MERWVRSYGCGTYETSHVQGHAYSLEFPESGSKCSPSIVLLDSFHISIPAVHSSTCGEKNYTGVMFQTKQYVL